MILTNLPAILTFPMAPLLCILTYSGLLGFSSGWKVINGTRKVLAFYVIFHYFVVAWKPHLHLRRCRYLTYTIHIVC